MPTQLVNLQVKEVSGVDHAANMRKFLIVKSATQGNSLKEKLANIIKQYLPPKNGTALTFSQAYAYETIDDQLYNMMYDAGYALRESIKSIMADTGITDKMAYINASLAEFSQVISSAFADALAFLASGTPVVNKTTKSKEGNGMPISEEVMKGLPEEVRTEIVKLQEEAVKVAALQKQLEDLQKSKEGQNTAPTTPTEDPVLKGLPPQVQALIADLQKRAQTAEEIAKAEKEARITKEYVAKAAQFTHLGINAEELGPVLKSLAEVNPEGYAKLEATLKAANTAIEKSALFQEVGKSGSGTTGGAWEKIEKKAEEIRKSDPSLTQEQAVAKVMREEPALYAEYIKEMQ